jgi:alpha-galactosidase
MINNKKLPGGLKELSQKIHDLEMLFGIWVEPEMVNEDSDLYRQHPEWAVAIPGYHHAKGRHQMLLDLTNQEVIAHLIEAMSRVFSSGQIDYVKWDMNRIVSDAYSQTLNANQQGEFYHRYVLGLYRLLTSLTQKFPEILFEACASGGNRFDLGMLCYMPQIWASDNTDAMSRLSIQEGYSYGYPQSVMGAHVSDCPNHQTLRQVPLETRFNVAALGLLGYECNLVDFSKEDIEHITAQVSLYKAHRQVFQFGDFYRLPLRGMSKNKGFMVVSPDETKAIACQYQEQVRPNAGERLFLGRGLKPSAIYRLYSLPHPINVKVFGDLINMASPVHIKNGSLVQHLVSKVYKLPGEIEEHTASGQLICQVGVALKQGYIGTGFNEQVSVYQDYASRMYFIEMENE